MSRGAGTLLRRLLLVPPRQRRELGQQLARHGRVDQRLTAVDGAHGVGHLVQRDVLEQVAAGPGPDGLEQVLFLVADRQHHDLGARGHVLQRPAGLDPAAARHPDVHQDDVRQRLPGLADGFLAVTGLADQLDVGLGLQHHLQAAPEQRMVIDDQRADGLGRGRAVPDGQAPRSCSSRVSASAASGASLIVRCLRAGPGTAAHDPSSSSDRAQLTPARSRQTRTPRCPCQNSCRPAPGCKPRRPASAPARARQCGPERGAASPRGYVRKASRGLAGPTPALLPRRGWQVRRRGPPAVLARHACGRPPVGAGSAPPRRCCA